jgi:hypothetical protein
MGALLSFVAAPLSLTAARVARLHAVPGRGEAYASNSKREGAGDVAIRPPARVG